MLKPDDQPFINLTKEEILEKLEPYKERSLYKLFKGLLDHGVFEGEERFTITGQEGHLFSIDEILPLTEVDDPDTLLEEYSRKVLYKNKEEIDNPTKQDDIDGLNQFDCYINGSNYEIVYKQDGTVLMIDEYLEDL